MGQKVNPNSFRLLQNRAASSWRAKWFAGRKLFAKNLQEDLKIRGSGNVLGYEQSGRGIFKYARPDDIFIMSQARDVASQILKNDPLLQNDDKLRERAEFIRNTAHGE